MSPCITAGASTLVSGVLAFGLVLVPTVLMGSTLPVLVTYCVRTIPNIGRWTGALYYVNTLGSAIACILAGMFTMRLLGESGSVKAAACINTVVGTVALAYHFTKGAHESSGDPTNARRSPSDGVAAFFVRSSGVCRQTVKRFFGSQLFFCLPRRRRSLI